MLSIIYNKQAKLILVLVGLCMSLVTLGSSSLLRRGMHRLSTAAYNSTHSSYLSQSVRHCSHENNPKDLQERVAFLEKKEKEEKEKKEKRQKIRKVCQYITGIAITGSAVYIGVCGALLLYVIKEIGEAGK